MKKKIAFRVTYYLVTTGFTLTLIFGTIRLATEIGNIVEKRWESELQVGVKLTGDIARPRIVGVMEDNRHHEFDTLAEVGKDQFSWSWSDHSMNIPVSYLRDSHAGFYYWSYFKHFLYYLSWLYILYQVFLILYDFGNEDFFIDKNISRMRKTGFCLLAMATLNLFQVHWEGYISGRNELVITSRYSQLFELAFFPYLLAGSFMFVLSRAFSYGMKLQQNES